MSEGHISELASPFCSHADSTEKCLNLVTEALPEVETRVGEFPDAVYAVGALGLR